MNPNTAQIAAIKTFVEAMENGWSNTDAEIRAAMIADLVSNPVSQPTIIKPFDAVSVLQSGQLSATSLGKLDTSMTFAQFIVPLLNNSPHTADDVTNLNAWALFQYSIGNLQESEYNYLAESTTGVFNLTELDPSWTSTVSWDVANLGRACDDFDLEATRGTL